MAKGDHFFVWRNHLGVPFQHHGIDVGDGTVVHFTDGDGGVAGPGGSTRDFVVTQTAMCVITRNGRDTKHVIQHARPLDADQIVDRARSRIGKQGYHLLFDNCEHFANWCAIGSETSRQVSTAVERIGAAGVKTLATGTIRLASRLGTRQLIRGTTPWMLVAEAAQWATEAGGHHVGLRDPDQRRQAGRAVGGATAVGIGAMGGPLGIAIAGAIWVAGEVAGEATSRVYEQLRTQRGTDAVQ